VPIVEYCPVCLGGVTTAYPRRGWRFSFEVVCSRDGCLLFDACWKCDAVVELLSSTVPSLDVPCRMCCAPLAKATSSRMSDAIPEQAMLYDELHRLTFGTAVNFAPAPGREDLGRGYIETLSSGVPCGTNPANAADRHNAVMLEAARLRETSKLERNKQARAARAATRAAGHVRSALPPRRG
jgi:hypothetical protein